MFFENVSMQQQIELLHEVAVSFLGMDSIAMVEKFYFISVACLKFYSK